MSVKLTQMYYRLGGPEGRTPEPCTPEEWGAWTKLPETFAARLVQRDETENGWTVVTVFAGLDYRLTSAPEWRDEPRPLPFVTRAFASGQPSPPPYYSPTWDAAALNHVMICDRVTKA